MHLRGPIKGIKPSVTGLLSSPLLSSPLLSSLSPPPSSLPLKKA